ncbi:hypothetical protein BHE74_00055079, partial [Ensete ventricosum]
LMPRPYAYLVTENVHSANALSWRHLRSLLRDRCSMQPATICFEQGFGLINVNKNSVSSCLGPPENGCNIDIEGAGKIDELEAVDNHSSWIRSSSTSSVIPMRRTADQFAGSVDSTLTKVP